MPKDTYMNLPEEKRLKIEVAAMNEFEKYGFDASSINRIVEHSGISKGSFYQYFEDKKDLYKHILNLMIAMKMKYVSPVLKNPDEHNFFVLIRELYFSALRFAMENPQMTAIGAKFIADKEHEIYKEVMKDNISDAYNIYEILLKKAIAKGEVRSDIDIKLTAYLILSLNNHVVEYHTKHVDDKWNERLMETLEKFLDFLEKGIVKNS